MNDSKKIKGNPLGEEEVSVLLRRFAPPAVISNLVSALYNIVDQIFIGQGVGYLGNAATNVAFPLTTVCMCVGLMTGVGSATLFNLEMGKGNREKVRKVCGSSLSTLFCMGLLLLLLVKVFMNPMLILFGATENNMEYARTYISITSWGIPFLLLSTGGNQMIRSDGSPMWSMTCMVSGALMNTILDPLFIFRFHMGIAGAAWATVISQIFSACLVVAYLPRFKTLRLHIRDFVPDPAVVREAWSLGLTAMFNNLSSLIVQIVLNNLLRRYGSQSAYGSDIPLAVAGIVTKVNLIFTSLILGIAQGAQPVNGFNTGARKFGRVRWMYRLEFKVCAVVGIAAFLSFQCLTGMIIGLFGAGNELYMEFASSYFRIFFALTMLNGVHTMSTMFCSQIGNARKGALLALTKQIFLLVPFLFLFSAMRGIDGLKYAAPAADAAAFVITMIALRLEFKHMPLADE